MAIKFSSLIKCGVLICIVVLGLVLRFWHFSANPPSLDWDEVSWGYNAYSILKTGKDEFGTFLPKYIRSLDDYKMPVYTYMTVGSVAAFGLNDFAVRFTSGFLGLSTVVALYFLVQELTVQNIVLSKQKLFGHSYNKLKVGTFVAILSALLLAIVPWHVQFSRVASEANSALFFLVSGVTVFLYSLRKRAWLMPMSILLLSLSAYTYRSDEVIAPLLIFILIVLYRKELIKIKERIPLVISGLLITLLLFLLASDVTSPTLNLRIKGTSVFDTNEANSIISAYSLEGLHDTAIGDAAFSKIFHNYRFADVQIIVTGYLAHFNPTFLFSEYYQRLFHTPFEGLLYLWMIFFIPPGVYYIARYYEKNSSRLIFILLLISPIPASITADVPSPSRVLSMVIPIVIIVASGVILIYQNIGNGRIVRYLYISTVTLFIIFSSIKYFHQYDTYLPYERSKDWIYGRKELVSYVEANRAKYKKIIISTSLEWPHIFFLYYSKYDPAKYLAQGGTVSGGWGEQENHYDTYQFRLFNAASDFQNLTVNDTLYAGLPKEFPSSIKPLRIIYYLNGEQAIWIVDKSSLLAVRK